MYYNGLLEVLNIQPGHPMDLTCAYRISKTGEHMLIKEWKKMFGHSQGGSWKYIKRKARIGDRIICILHNGERGAILFFAILP